MEHFLKGDLDIAYELTGKGEHNLVFLNGIAMTASHWYPLIENLKENYKILLHDFRGQLLSDKKSEVYSLDGHAHDLASLMDHISLDRAHIIGTSYGSEVAMHFALLYPQRCKNIVIIDGVSELDSVLTTAVDSWKCTALADPRLFYKTILPWNYSSGYLAENLPALRDREDKIARLPEEYFKAFARLCDAFLQIDLTEKLKGINCPTLVLVGELDILKHRGFSEIINSNMENSELKIIEGAGHAVVIEKPDSVAALIELFLN